MSRMETYPTTLSLGDESAQMTSLNRRLEAYLSRVKTLEEENELLRAEIHHLKSTRSDKSTVRKYHDEIMKLRDALDDGHREMVLVEIDRDSIHQELEYVKELCHHEKQAQEDAKKELSESKKLLEEEKRAQTWLKERLIQLEQEMDDILQAHEEDKALIEQEISSYSQRLENFKIVPANFKPVNVEDYANRLSQIWQGAVEEYKSEVSVLEANLSHAKENLKKVLDENKQSQQQLQNLDRDLQSLKVRKEMLENLLADQWLEQQEEEGRLQLDVETLEKEKQDLRVQIAQVLEDRQQLMHLKMSLSLEVATYRSLLEAESTRIYSPSADYKTSSFFNDLVQEQSSFRKSRHENIKALVPSDNRLKANKKQSAETPSTNRYLQVKSTSFSNRSSPVTKEFQKVSSVLQSQGLNYTKASTAKAATPLPPVESNLGRNPQNVDVVKKKKVHFVSHSYSEDCSKPVTKEIIRKDEDIQPVLNGDVYHAIDTELKKTDSLNDAKGEKETVSIQVESSMKTEAEQIKVISDFGLEQQHFFGAQKSAIDTLAFEKLHKENTDFEVLLVHDDHTSMENIDGEHIIEKQEVTQTVSSQSVYAEREEIVEPVEYHNLESSIKVHNEELRKVLDFSKPNTKDIDEPNGFCLDSVTEQETEYYLSQELDMVKEDTNQEADEHKESKQLNEGAKLNCTEETPIFFEAKGNLQDEEVIIDQKFQVLSSLKEDSDQERFELCDSAESKGHLSNEENVKAPSIKEEEEGFEDYGSEENIINAEQNINIEQSRILVVKEVYQSTNQILEDFEETLLQYEELKNNFELSDEISQSYKVQHRSDTVKTSEEIPQEFCDTNQEESNSQKEILDQVDNVQEEVINLSEEILDSALSGLKSVEQSDAEQEGEKISGDHIEIKQVVQTVDSEGHIFLDNLPDFKQEELHDLVQNESVISNEEVDIQIFEKGIEKSVAEPQIVQSTSEHIIQASESDKRERYGQSLEQDVIQEDGDIKTSIVELKSSELKVGEDDGDASKENDEVCTSEYTKSVKTEVIAESVHEKCESYEEDNVTEKEGPASAGEGEYSCILEHEGEKVLTQGKVHYQIVSTEDEYEEHKKCEENEQLEQKESGVQLTIDKDDELLLKENEPIVERQSKVSTDIEQDKSKLNYVLQDSEVDEDQPFDRETCFQSRGEDVIQSDGEKNHEESSKVNLTTKEYFKSTEGENETFMEKNHVEEALPITTHLLKNDQEVEGQVGDQQEVEEEQESYDQKEEERQEVKTDKLGNHQEIQEGKEGDHQEIEDQVGYDIVTENVVSKKDNKINQSLQKEFEEQFAGFSLNIIQNNLRFTSENDGDAEVEQKENNFSDKEAEAHKDEINVYEEESKNFEHNNDDIILEQKEREQDIFEKEIICEQSTISLKRGCENLLIENSKSHVLFAQNPTENYNFDGPTEKNLTELDEIEAANDPDNENSKFEDSMDSQDISIYSQKSDEFEISKDYQLEQTLPDTTPLPNLDEFEDLVDDEIITEQSAEVTESQCPTGGSKAEEVSDGSLESQSSQILPEVSDQSSESPIDVIESEHPEHFVDHKVDTEDSSAALVTEEPVSEDSSAAPVTEEPASDTFEDPVKSKIDDEKTWSENLEDPKLDIEESSTSTDAEKVTKSQSLTECDDAEEVINSSLESQSLQIVLEEVETHTDQDESEQPEHFVDPKVNTEDSSAALVTEESEDFEDPVESNIDDEKIEYEDLVDPKLDTEETFTTPDTEEVTKSQSLAEGDEAEKVLDSNLESKSSQILLEEDETPKDQVESEHPEQFVDHKGYTEDSSAALFTEEPVYEDSSAARVNEEPVSEDPHAQLVTEEPASETFEDPVESKIDGEKTQSEEVTKSQSLAKGDEAEKVLDSNLESKSSQILLEEGATPTGQVESEHPEQFVDPKLDTEDSSAALVSITFEDPVESKIDDEKTQSEDLVDPKLDTEQSRTPPVTEEVTKSQSIVEGDEAEEVLDSSIESKSSQILLEEGATPTNQVESEHLEQFVDPKVETKDSSAALVTEEPASEDSSAALVTEEPASGDSSAVLVTEETASETFEDTVESKIDDEKTQYEDLVDSKLDSEESSTPPDTEEVTKSQSLADGDEAEEVLDSSLESKSSQILLEEGATPTEQVESEHLENFVDPKVETEDSSAALVTEEPASEDSSAALVTEEPASGDSPAAPVTEEHASEPFEDPVESKIDDEKTQSEDPTLDTEESSTLPDTEEVTKSQSLADSDEAEEVLDSSLESQSSQILLEEGETPTDQVESEHPKLFVDPKGDTEDSSAVLVTEEPVSKAFEDPVESKIEVEKTQSEDLVDSKLDTEESSTTLNTEEVTKLQSFAEGNEAEEVLDSSLESKSSQILLEEGETPTDQVESEHPVHFADPKLDTEDSSAALVTEEPASEDSSAALVTEEPASETFEDPLESKIDDENTQSEDLEDPRLDTEESSTPPDTEDVTKSQSLADSDEAEEVLDSSLESKSSQILLEEGATPTDQVESEDLEQFVDPKVETEDSSAALVTEEPASEDSSAALVTEEPASGDSSAALVTEEHASEPFEDPVESKIKDEKTQSEDPTLDTEESSTPPDIEEVTKSQSLADGDEAEEVLDSSLESKSSQILLEEGATPTEQVESEHLENFVDPKVETEDSSAALVTEEPASEDSSAALVTEEPASGDSPAAPVTEEHASEPFEDPVESKIDDEKTQSEDPTLDTEESSTLPDTEEVTKSQSLADSDEAEEVLDSSLESQSSQILLEEGETPTDQVESEHPKLFVDPKGDTEDSSAVLVTEEPVSKAFEDPVESKIEVEKTQSEDLVDSKLDTEESSTTLNTEEVTKLQSFAEGNEAEEVLDSSLESKSSQILLEEGETPTDQVESEHPVHFADPKLDTEDSSAALVTEEPASEDSSAALVTEEPASETFEDPLESKIDDENTQSEDLEDPRLDTEESSTPPDTEDVTKSQSLADSDEAEEVLDSSLESKSSQILLEEGATPTDQVESEDLEQFVDPKVETEDSSAALVTEEPASEDSSAALVTEEPASGDSSAALVTEEPASGDSSAALVTEEHASEPFEDPVESKIKDEKTQSEDPTLDTEESSTPPDIEEVTKSQNLADSDEAEEVLDSSLESQSSQKLLEEGETPTDQVESEHLEQLVDPKVETEDSSAALVTEEPASKDPSAVLVTEEPVSKAFEDTVESKIDVEKTQSEDLVDSKLDTEESSTTLSTEEVTKLQSFAEGNEAEEVLDSSLESQSSQILLEEGATPTDQVESEHLEQFVDPKMETEDSSAALVTEEPASGDSSAAPVTEEPASEDSSAVLVNEEPVSKAFEDTVESKIDVEKTQSEDLVDSKLDTEESSTTLNTEEVTKLQSFAEGNEAEEVLDSSLESKSSQILLEEGETPTDQVESEHPEHFADAKLDTEDSSAALVTEEPASEDSSAALVTEEPASETFEDPLESKIDDEKTQSEDIEDPKLDTEESSAPPDTEDVTKSQSLADSDEAEEALDSSLESKSSQILLEEGATPTDQVESEHLEQFVDPKMETEDSSAALVTEEPASGDSSAASVTEEHASEPFEDPVKSKIDDEKTQSEDPTLDTEESSTLPDTEEVTKSQSLADSDEAEEVLDSSLESQSSQILLEEGETPTDQVESEHPKLFVDPKGGTEDSSAVLVTEEPVSKAFEDPVESKIDVEKTQSEDLVDSKLDTEESSTTLNTEEVTKLQSFAEGNEAEEVLDSSLESKSSQILLEGETPTDQVESEHPEHFADPKLDTEDSSAALVTEEPASETFEDPVENKVDDEKTQSEDLVDPKLDTEQSSTPPDTEEVTKKDGEAGEALDFSLESQSSQVLLGEGKTPTDGIESQHPKHFADTKLDIKESATLNAKDISESLSPTDKGKAKEVLISSLESHSSQILSEVVSDQSNVIKDSEYNKQQVEIADPEHFVDPKMDVEDTSAIMVTEEPPPKTFEEQLECNANDDQSTTYQKEIATFSPKVIEFETSKDSQVEKNKFDTTPLEDQEHLSSDQLGKESVDDDHNEKHEERRAILNEDTNTENLLTESTEFILTSETELVPSPSHENITEIEEYIIIDHSDLSTQDFSLEQRENVDTEDCKRDKKSDVNSPDGTKGPSTECLDEFNKDNIISYALGEEYSKTQFSEEDDIGVDTDSKSPKELEPNDPLLTLEPALEGRLMEQIEPQTSSDDEKDIISERGHSSCDSSKELDNMSEFTREYSEDGKTVNGIYGHTIVQATLDLDGHIYNGHSTEQESNIIISEAKIVRSDGDIVKSQSQDKIEDSLIEFTMSDGKSEGFFQSLLETSEYHEGCLDKASEIKNNTQTSVKYMDSDAAQSNYTKKLINPYLSERDLDDPSEISSSVLNEDLVDTNQEVNDTNQGLKINQKQDLWSSDE